MLKDLTLKKDGGIYSITNTDKRPQDVKITKMKLINWPKGVDF